MPCKTSKRILICSDCDSGVNVSIDHFCNSFTLQFYTCIHICVVQLEITRSTLGTAIATKVWSSQVLGQDLTNPWCHPYMDSLLAVQLVCRLLWCLHKLDRLKCHSVMQTRMPFNNSTHSLNGSHSQMPEESHIQHECKMYRIGLCSWEPRSLRYLVIWKSPTCVCMQEIALFTWVSDPWNKSPEYCTAHTGWTLVILATLALRGSVFPSQFLTCQS